MRDDLYTPAVVRALEAAPAWARRHGADRVQPLHLLLGLVQEEEGRAYALLTEAGLEGARVFAWAGVDAVPPNGAEGGPPLSTAAEEVLVKARGLVREVFCERTVASEHLLLTVLQCDTVLRETLEGLGLTFARVEESVMSALGPPLRMDEPLDLDGIPTEADNRPVLPFGSNGSTLSRVKAREELEKSPDPILGSIGATNSLVGVSGDIELARVLDASANRAREALRVLEDHCRFVLSDAFLTGELKHLRHDLASALASVPSSLLLAARETLRDVGTQITTEREQQRQTLDEVVQANVKRLQEALRSLEEYGKLREPRLGQMLESLRYRAYTLERALVLGGGARLRLKEISLYLLVTGALCARPLEKTIHEAAAGGVQAVQLREKQLDDRTLLERARKVRRWTRAAGVLFFMNDRPDLARLAEADGIHVGQKELLVQEVRRIVGPDALIGVSTHNVAQVRQAILDGADYLGVGPVFASPTKRFKRFPGLNFVQQAIGETSLPAFAIGGVALKNLSEVLATGARRIAVGSAICGDEDPRTAAAALRQLLDAAGKQE